jgi:hypothetical protein
VIDHLKRNANLVEALGSALRQGGHALGTVPDLLKQVLTEESWREFVTQRGEKVDYERFADFVTEQPLKGLGGDVDLVRRIVADDPEALDLLDRAVQNPPALHNVQSSAPTGNAQDAALRRLRKDAPALHAEVLAGNLSAHAAMVRGGLRRKQLSIIITEPERIAAALRRQLPPEMLPEIARLLSSIPE